MAFDASTNSLVVFASRHDFHALRRLIKKLDLPRKQVLVEALVLEVLLDRTLDMGVAFHAGRSMSVAGKESVVVGGFDAGRSLQPSRLAGDLVGLGGAVFGPALDAATSRLFGVTADLPSFGALLRLLQRDNDVNVLSSPHLLILDHEQGDLAVGQNLPFPSGFLAGFSGLAAVQRQDVSLRMKISPSVNADGWIHLDLDVQISELAAPNFNGLGPATSKRAVRTSVFCRDQQTVVIGGLMVDRVSETARKIPLLGDIPGLGILFRDSSRQTQKSNIVIALTPRVVSHPDDLVRIAEAKARERRELTERLAAMEQPSEVHAPGIAGEVATRGMLEEIHRATRDVDGEDEALRRMRAREAAIP
jgi:general secretion pathway protein D